MKSYIDFITKISAEADHEECGFHRCSVPETTRQVREIDCAREFAREGDRRFHVFDL